jgi:hypothetical protein
MRTHSQHRSLRSQCTCFRRNRSMLLSRTSVATRTPTNTHSHTTSASCSTFDRQLHTHTLTRTCYSTQHTRWHSRSCLKCAIKSCSSQAKHGTSAKREAMWLRARRCVHRQVDSCAVCWPCPGYCEPHRHTHTCWHSRNAQSSASLGSANGGTRGLHTGEAA